MRLDKRLSTGIYSPLPADVLGVAPLLNSLEQIFGNNQ